MYIAITTFRLDLVKSSVRMIENSGYRAVDGEWLAQPQQELSKMFVPPYNNCPPHTCNKATFVTV